MDVSQEWQEKGVEMSCKSEKFQENFFLMFI